MQIANWDHNVLSPGGWGCFLRFELEELCRRREGGWFSVLVKQEVLDGWW